MKDYIRAQIAAHRGEMPWTDHLATFDGNEHASHRAIMQALLTHKRLKANEEYMTGLSERMVGEVVAKGGCDLISEIATPSAPARAVRPMRWT